MIFQGGLHNSNAIWFLLYILVLVGQMYCFWQGLLGVNKKSIKSCKVFHLFLKLMIVVHLLWCVLSVVTFDEAGFVVVGVIVVLGACWMHRTCTRLLQLLQEREIIGKDMIIGGGR